MIRTRFEEVNANLFLEDLVMPYPVRVGEKVRLSDGFTWDVQEVTWRMDPFMVDKTGARLATLLVKVN